jgi:hypothetical protein
MRSLLLGLSGALALAGCDRPVTAPTRTGVCWRVAAGPDGEPHFRPFVTGIENLESCAARLEGLHLKTGEPVNGAFQGRFIFVTADAVTAGPRLTGQHYRVFDPAQREEIRRNLRALQARDREG